MKRINQASVDLMAWAMGGLLPKLREFFKQEHNLQTSMKKDLESLERQLRRMDACQFKMSHTEDQLDPHDRHFWAIDAWELSYEIEDTLDSLLLRVQEGSEPTDNQNSSLVRETLEDIKVLVNNLSDFRRVGHFEATTTSSAFDDCIIDDAFKAVRQLLGIHELTAEVISKMSSSRGLKKVSIWAAAGMGKTTLAKAVYDNIKAAFHCSAFVSVGLQPDMKKALRDIIIDLAKERYSDLNVTILDEKQLIDELRHFLKNKRFLIVIDDIRDIPSWEVLKCALVDSGCGSRIVTTSRVLDVAKSSGEVLELMPLSIDDSRELFYATLYDHKGTITFSTLVEQFTEDILQKCGGVPLAIIIIASLLAGKPQEEWTKVYNSIGLGQVDNIASSENTRKIIQFSYYDLPSHLKTCLLYLSIFPENHVIEKDTLVWRWVAEGFVRDEEQGGSLFKVGERYLYELISKSMMQPVGNEDTSICACRVDGMVLDWIRTVAKEENFVTILDWYDHDPRLSSYQDNAYIVAVQNRALGKHDLTTMCKPKVRSFSGTGCRISSMMPVLPSFQVLRVLSLEGCEVVTADDGSDGLKNLAWLRHLRYLGIRGMNIRNLPMNIGDLRYLQTLDLTSSNIETLPCSVTLLRQLKCLRCFALMLRLPEGMGNLSSLEELRLGTVVNGSKDLANELSKLTELRVICINYKGRLGERWKETLLESLIKLHKIEELELFCHGPGSHEPCHHVIGPGAFPKLRYLKMNTWLINHPGAMSSLKSVEFGVHVWALEYAYFDFHDLYKLRYLRLLEKVHVRIVCWEAKKEKAEEAEAALRRVLHNHPNRPTLTLTRYGWCADEKEFRSLGLHGSRVAPQVMPLEFLRKITNDFSEKQMLGSGTFGAVYKGVQNDKPIAVKLLHSLPQRLDYEEEFMKEFENLRRLNHPNIIQLLGYCYEIKRECVEFEGRSVIADKIYRALCFEYMPNGSLQGYLDDESRGLDWHTRYKIIKEACEGLKYLHEGLKTPMYHLDLKPDNILLDENMVPKLADFGLSKHVSDNQTQATSSSLGTIRYCPPEHIERNYFSNKFDIFSLGVVMIEIIAGTEGYRKVAEMPSKEFIHHVQENWRNRLQEALGCMSLIYQCHQVKGCIEIALDCIHPDRTQRPDIGNIISRLNGTENEKLAMTQL